MQTLLVNVNHSVNQHEIFKVENRMNRELLQEKSQSLDGDNDSTTDDSSLDISMDLESLEASIISNINHQEALAVDLDRMKRRLEYIQCEASIIKTRVEQFSYKEYELLTKAYGVVKERTSIMDNRTENIKRIGYPKFEEKELLGLMEDINQIEQNYVKKRDSDMNQLR